MIGLIIFAILALAIVAALTGRQYEVRDNEHNTLVTVTWSYRGAQRWIKRNSYPGRCFTQRKWP